MTVPGGRVAAACRSEPQMPQSRTRTSSSPGSGSGRGISSTTRRPASLSTAARTGTSVQGRDATPRLASPSTWRATGAAAVGNSSARERAPRAAVDPAHVGGQRADVVLREEAAEGCHLDRLATEEERADRVLGDSPVLTLRDPVPELL